MNTDFGSNLYEFMLKIKSDLCLSVKICVPFFNSELRLRAKLLTNKARLSDFAPLRDIKLIPTMSKDNRHLDTLSCPSFAVIIASLLAISSEDTL